jgi:cell wall-associated NlpC family hydrolase
MKVRGIIAAAAVFFIITPALAQHREKKTAIRSVNATPYRQPSVLTPEDGLSVIAAALDLRANKKRRTDCSHLVHDIYERAGFAYPYASSSDLYDGSDNFSRVSHPQPGDLIVWSGHVGIVINPAQHLFYSALRSGVGVDAYDTDYWQERGSPRFYRYIKSGDRESE